MKRISWKIRVTIWYTTFVLLMTGFSLFLIIRYAERTFQENYETELEESLEDFIDDLEIENDEIQPGKYGFYENDIIYSVYNENGELLAGAVPKFFPENTVLKSDMSQLIEYEDLQWRTYDKYITVEEKNYWIRGVMYTTRSAQMENTVLFIELSILPLLAILAAIGGYFITKRAFAPVEQMRSTAEKIAMGGDIKERVPEWKASGEMKRLALSR